MLFLNSKDYQSLQLEKTSHNGHIEMHQIGRGPIISVYLTKRVTTLVGNNRKDIFGCGKLFKLFIRQKT
jgi:hypothetical protein